MARETAMQKSSEAEVARAERTRSGQVYRPNVDIIERKDELIVEADIPGTTREAIDVRFENGTLEIDAQVAPRRATNERFLLHEYGVGDFYRSFQVSESIDSAKITAEYADGVLTLHLPKVEAAKPRKIAVKTA